MVALPVHQGPWISEDPGFALKQHHLSKQHHLFPTASQTLCKLLHLGAEPCLHRLEQCSLTDGATWFGYSNTILLQRARGVHEKKTFLKQHSLIEAELIEAEPSK